MSNELFTNPPFTVYYRNNCPHCAKAKNALSLMQFEYRAFNVLKDADAYAFVKDYWGTENKTPTLPLIVHHIESGDLFIEGSEELFKYLQR